MTNVQRTAKCYPSIVSASKGIRIQYIYLGSIGCHGECWTVYKCTILPASPHFYTRHSHLHSDVNLALHVRRSDPSSTESGCMVCHVLSVQSSSTWLLLLKHINGSFLISLPCPNTVKLMPNSNRTTHVRILCGKPCNFFADLLISAGFWPHTQSRLVHLAFHLWSHLKDKMFSTAPATIDELKSQITEEIKEIDGRMLKNIFSNLIERCQACIGWWASELFQVFP